MKTDTYKKFLQSSRFFNCFLSSPLGLAGGDNAVAYIQAHKPLFVNNLIPNNVISTVNISFLCSLILNVQCSLGAGRQEAATQVLAAKDQRRGEDDPGKTQLLV